MKDRIREREGRRTRRKLDRQKAGIKNHHIGDSRLGLNNSSTACVREKMRFSKLLLVFAVSISIHPITSDEEMTPEQTALFEEKRQKLEENRLAIFDDVIEEYIDCRMLLNRFNQFRDSYNKYYKVCFIEECAGSVLIPVLKGSTHTFAKY